MPFARGAVRLLVPPAGAVLVAAAFSGCSGSKPEAAPTRAGSSGARPAAGLPAAFREFEELTDKPSANIDPAETILALSAAVHRDLLGGTLEAAPYLEEIDSLAEVGRRRLGRGEGGEEGKGGRGRATVEVLRALVYEDLAVTAVLEEEKLEHLFPDAVLDRRRGSCLALSGLILSLAYRLDLPVKGVLAPGHFFVRYDDGRERVNIETLKAGIERTDGFYREWFGVPPTGGAAYMRSLDTRGTLAVLLFNTGNAYREAGRLEGACTLYERAVAMLPDFPEVHGNLGVVFFAERKVGRAVASFRRAVELNPLLEGAHRNLALIYEAEGEAELAREHRDFFERARAERIAREARRPGLLRWPYP